jgi:YfiH family protein
MYITHSDYSPKNIKYGFFTKENAVNKATVQEDLNIISKRHGFNGIATVKQEHTNHVVLVKDCLSRPVADGQITNISQIALGVLTADCVPILLADEQAGIVSTVHAGWRGAKANIMQEAISKMKEIGAKNITAIIGPCIQQNCYEFGADLYQNFVDESSDYRKFFIPSASLKHYMFDLPGYVKEKLKLAGANNILDVNRNTYEEEEKFFSFRRYTHNPQSSMGNNLSVIMLL